MDLKKVQDDKVLPHSIIEVLKIAHLLALVSLCQINMCGLKYDKIL